MPISLSKQDGHLVVTLSDDLTIYQVAEYRDTLLVELGDVSDIRVDISGVGEVDTAGIQLLIALSKQAGITPDHFALAGHSEAVASAIALLGLDEQFPLVQEAS